MTRKLSLFSLIGLIAVFAMACGSSEPPTPTPALPGTLNGTVNIGPLCPVEPCVNPTNPYLGLDAVLVDIDLEEIARSPLDAEGDFQLVGPSGFYSLYLDPCEYLGCGAALPLQLSINPTTPGMVEVNIDTGIR